MATVCAFASHSGQESIRWEVQINEDRKDSGKYNGMRVTGNADEDILSVLEQVIFTHRCNMIVSGRRPTRVTMTLCYAPDGTNFPTPNIFALISDWTT